MRIDTGIRQGYEKKVEERRKAFNGHTKQDDGWSNFIHACLDIPIHIIKQFAKKKGVGK